MKGFLSSTRYKYPKSIAKLNLSNQVWSHQRSIFWKKYDTKFLWRNKHFPRPAETDPYVSTKMTMEEKRPFPLWSPSLKSLWPSWTPWNQCSHSHPGQKCWKSATELLKCDRIKKSNHAYFGTFDQHIWNRIKMKIGFTKNCLLGPQILGPLRQTWPLNRDWSPVFNGEKLCFFFFIFHSRQKLSDVTLARDIFPFGQSPLNPRYHSRISTKR